MLVRVRGDQGEGRGERDLRLARRCALTDREQQEIELSERMDAWQRSFDREERSGARTRGGAETQAWPPRKARIVALRGTPLPMSTRTRNLVIEILINRRLMSRRIRGGKGKRHDVSSDLLE